MGESFPGARNAETLSGAWANCNNKVLRRTIADVLDPVLLI